MGKKYGQRWESVDGTLGEGGQANVIQVQDRLNPQGELWALKRIKNPKRRERFRNEVNAIKKLDHPNIIKLEDHSALDGDDSPDKQYLVMPIAAGGDLSQVGRLALYKGDIDAVLNVAGQVASALKHAHENGVIHRDIKPANILATGNGHEVWVSDFGVCLLREEERVTDLNEVVGPRVFMAPELESGGKLEVTPAADVYSLGKVIYYLISGGELVPREAILEPRYREFLETGERRQLLLSFLSRMIAPLSSRLRTMDDVLRELSRISDWERSATASGISPALLEVVARFNVKTVEQKRVAENAAAARKSETEKLKLVTANLIEWLETSLQPLVNTLNSDQIRVEAQVITPQETNGWLDQGRRLKSQAGYELSIMTAKNDFGSRNVLEFHVCRMISFNGSAPSPEVMDLDIGVIPCVRVEHIGPSNMKIDRLGFLTRPSLVGTIYQRYNVDGLPASGLKSARFGWVIDTYTGDRALGHHFVLSGWPAVIDKLAAMKEASLSAFISEILK